MPGDARSAPVQFRPGQDLARQLEERVVEDFAGSYNAVAKRDLERYYDALERELALQVWTEAEASAICDALNGLWLRESLGIRYAWAEIADANGLGEKWGVDQADLVRRVRELQPGGLCALADAVERFWADPERPTAVALREVGLVRSVG